MTMTFKALSALMSYPTEELQVSANELRDALRTEAIVPFAAGSSIASSTRSPKAISSTSRNATCCCSIAPAPCRCTSSSTYMARAAIAVRR